MFWKILFCFSSICKIKISFFCRAKKITLIQIKSYFNPRTQWQIVWSFWEAFKSLWLHSLSLYLSLSISRSRFSFETKFNALALSVREDLVHSTGLKLLNQNFPRIFFFVYWERKPICGPVIYRIVQLQRRNKSQTINTTMISMGEAHCNAQYKKKESRLAFKIHCREQ